METGSGGETFCFIYALQSERKILEARKIMAKRILFSLLAAAIALTTGIFVTVKKVSAKANTTAFIAGPSINSVTAYTKDIGHDQNYHHCFYQDSRNDLYFEVKTDTSVSSVNFVLVNINDPKNPTVAEPAKDWPVNKVMC
jgi:hypothetical protein